MNREAMPVTGLDQLISRIRAEAIEEADRKAAEVLSRAEHEASRIVRDAEVNAREIAVSSEKEIAKRHDAALKALRRAARDTVIETRQLILSLFSSVLQAETRSTLSGDSLAVLIGAFIKRLIETAGRADVSVHLGFQESQELIAAVREHLRSVTGEGLELKTDPDLRAGFRIGFREGNFFYEISPEAVTEIIMNHLTPELVRLFSAAEDKT